MEKIDIKIASKESVVVPFGDGIVKVSQYISLSNKIILMKIYIEALLEQNSDIYTSYLKAEYGLILGILNANTSVNVDNVSVEDVVTSGLWDKVKENIKNYDEFKQQIVEAYDLVSKQGNSWKHIFEYISTWVDSQLSSDKIKELSKQLSSKKVDDYFPAIKEQEQLPVIIKKTRKPKIGK